MTISQKSLRDALFLLFGITMAVLGIAGVRGTAMALAAVIGGGIVVLVAVFTRSATRAS